jgi:hypothetical protein
VIFCDQLYETAQTHENMAKKPGKPNLLHHKSGRYYARAFASGKEVWKLLTTSHYSVARLNYDEKHIGKTALRPFHSDKHPSFSVFQDKDGLWLWNCFAGCGEGDETRSSEN